MCRLKLSLLLQAGACAVQTFAQDVPAALLPPTGQRELFAAHAVGVQVYDCESHDGHFQWTLVGPEAELHDNSGKLIGKHSAGPTWQSIDQSSVKGKVIATVASPDGKSVPWLLLSAAAHSGMGVMSSVLSIQRLNTSGGVAPLTVCDNAHQNAATRVKYTADYHFYGDPSAIK